MGEDRGCEGGETAFRLYCMRKESMFNKQGDHQKRPIISKHFFPEAPQKSMFNVK